MAIVDKITESQVWKSIFRHPMPTDRRNRVVVMLTNFFLHLHPVSVPQAGDRAQLHLVHGRDDLLPVHPSKWSRASC
jgi:hypothetical protein